MLGNILYQNHLRNVDMQFGYEKACSWKSVLLKPTVNLNMAKNFNVYQKSCKNHPNYGTLESPASLRAVVLKQRKRW